VTSDPLADQRAAPATELAEAVEAQIREVREVLRADAEAVGMDPELVDAAAASFGGARVHAFIGILVEREVRARLRLAHGTTNNGQGNDNGTRK
jgi:hypothetical protein